MRLSNPAYRLNACLLVVAFVLGLFAGRLVRLQAIDSHQYTAEALAQRIRKIDLPAERGVITDVNGVHPISFGQSVSVTSLQMAGVYATIANGGVRVTPSVVAGTYDGRGEFVPAPAPASRRVVGPDTARRLTSMLEAVVNQGTALKARLAGYRVAGKTGTANRYNPSKKNKDGSLGGYDGYTGMFAGFAPAEDPRVVVQIVLQNPRKGYHGGAVAAPVFKELLTFALQTLKVPPGSPPAPAIRLTVG